MARVKSSVMLRVLASSEVGRLLRRRAQRMAAAEEVVRPILADVRKRGDQAVLDYAKRFDHLERRTVRVAWPELAGAAERLPGEFRRAVKSAERNIRAYAKAHLPKATSFTLAPGLRAGQIVRPLDTIAAYIPGGRYPLPSTVLMTVIPAQVAGVERICVTCPKPADEVFGTAALLGVKQVFQMGGAHAIAAFAYGTKSVPRADRVVGPGNIYVAAAKKLLAGEVGIDFVAGPTEILIISTGGDPEYLAADMLAQAEHDADASAILLTTSRSLGQQVAAAVARQLETLPTAPVAAEAIRRNSAVLVVESLEEAVEIANRIAPEHLSIPDRSLLAGIRHAGSIFIGEYSTEAAGDYAAGPNHVLPTGGVARLRAGLSVSDYLKQISTQELSRAALARLAPTITTLARSEGLEAHARSVEVRIGGQ